MSRYAQGVDPTKGLTMTDTTATLPEIEIKQDVVADALAIVDKALTEMLRRELVSTTEVADLLLDLRSVLSR